MPPTGPSVNKVGDPHWPSSCAYVGLSVNWLKAESPDLFLIFGMIGASLSYDG